MGENGSSQGAPETLRRRRALIVDDEAGVRESLRMVLKDAYDLVAVSSGSEALEAVAKGAPDVVLLDIVMPGMDGMQVLEELRTRYPNLFLNTGHGTLGWTQACGSGRALADIIGGRKPEVDFNFT